MFVLGLTGGIGQGKSTVASFFTRAGVPVHDSDAAVHALYAPGGRAVAPVAAAFSPAVLDPAGGISRPALAAAVLGKPDALAALEGIVHPLVTAERAAWLDAQAAAAADGAGSARGLVVLDIPLLFETGADAPEAGAAVGVEAARGCPECRTVSHFVVPSATWPTSPADKAAIIDGYKAALARTPCRNFAAGRGTCPHGTSCLYQHADEHGVEVDRAAALRWVGDEDGVVKPMAGGVRLGDFLSGAGRGGGRRRG